MRPSPAPPSSPYLSGNFAPVGREVDADALAVIGALPRELDGLFLRNGPNPRFAPATAYHWFDGDGMLHGLRIAGGRAAYRNRWVRTPAWRAEHEAGRALWPGLAAPLAFEAPAGMPIKHTANTALAFHAGKLLALMEASVPYEVPAPSLDAAAPHDFGGAWPGAFTAHPKVDPRTGEMVFFGYELWPPRVAYGVASADGAVAHRAEIDLRAPVMMHDFAITERHAVLMDLPLTFDVERLQRGAFPLVFRPELGARFGVMPRRGSGGDVRWFEAPPCMVFHTANAWCEGDEVVLVACRMNETDALAGPLREEGDPRGDDARLHRWRFDLATGAAREEPLDDAPCDFPRINESRTGLPTRYVYAARTAPPRGDALPWSDGVVKYELETGSSETHGWGRGRFGGEAVFVPRAGAVAEDDGWLATFVWDEFEQRSEFVLVDARDLASAPVARVLLPQRVPFGFHGLWLDASRLRG